jgi:hypothetical protein
VISSSTRTVPEVAATLLLRRKLPIRPFFIDTNMINAREKLAPMNTLEKWSKNDVIDLRMPENAQLEAEAGHCNRRARKAWSYIAPLPLITTAEEKAKLSLIEKILWDEKPMSQSDQCDALIVFTAVKYAGVLITADGGSKSQPRGMLGAAAELRQCVGAQIISAADAVEMVRKDILARDKFARRFCAQRKLKLPHWVGAD